MRLAQRVGGEVFQFFENFRHHALTYLQVCCFDIHAVDRFGTGGAHAQVVVIISSLVAELHFHQFISDSAEVVNVQPSDFQSVCSGMLGEVEIVIDEGFFRLERRVNI